MSFIDLDELKEALYSATTVEPIGADRKWEGHGERTLGDWKTLRPAKRKSMKSLRRQILSFLSELNEGNTIADLRESLEHLAIEDE
jgi:hypothetical protein